MGAHTVARGDRRQRGVAKLSPDAACESSVGGSGLASTYRIRCQETFLTSGAPMVCPWVEPGPGSIILHVLHPNNERKASTVTPLFPGSGFQSSIVPVAIDRA